MNEIALAKQSLDIAAVIESEGIQLTYKNGKYFGHCPFHDDKTPSFVVYEHHCHCYGCNFHQDVIGFIQYLYDYDFKGACRHLGIEIGRPTRQTRQKIIQLQQKRAEKQAYQKRERDLAFTLATQIRWTNKAMGAIRTIEQLEEFADLIHSLPFWKQCHLILCTGEPAERRHVVETLKDLDTIDRNPLWSPDFNYRAWLNQLGAPKIETQSTQSSRS